MTPAALAFARIGEDARQYRLANRVKALLDQYPKRCGCGHSYRPGDWAQLPFAYVRSDDFATSEGRHCGCGSTLEVYLAIRDVEAE